MRRNGQTDRNMVKVINTYFSFLYLNIKTCYLGLFAPINPETVFCIQKLDYTCHCCLQ